MPTKIQPRFQQTALPRGQLVHKDSEGMKLLKFWGWGLVIISFAPWLLVLTLPWWPLATNQRLLATVVLLAIAEVLFWLGALIVGKQAVQKYRQYFTWRHLKRVWQKLKRW